MPLFRLRADRQSRVIILAYAVFCAGLLFTSSYVLQQVRLLLSTTESLYLHPFTVSNKALEARLVVKAMRDDILFAVLSRDRQAARRALEEMSGREAAFDAALAEVRTLYLGDPGQVARAGELFAAWKPVRDAILDTAARGDFEQARRMVLSSGTPAYNSIDQELEQIVAFARNRASLYIQEARKQRESTERATVLVLLGGFAASFLCSAVVIRRMRQVARSHEETLEFLAHHDALTQLPNRQLLSDRLGQALRLAERDKGLLALCYVDLDGFKAINDLHGHEAGDAVLIRVADALSGSVRQSDTVARIGGDEFVLLLQRPKDREALTDLAEKILLAVSAPVPFRGEELALGASLGIALYPEDATTPETLLARADAAMYQAKQSGRGQFRFYAEKPRA